MAGRVMCFIGGVVGSVGHLVVRFAVVVAAEAGVLILINMSDVMEQGSEENIAILTQ